MTGTSFQYLRRTRRTETSVFRGDETLCAIYTNGRSLSALRRGKLLGGSSALNGMAWNRASSPEYDAWSQFSSDEWTWDGLLPYLKRAEAVNTSQPNPYPGISSSEQQQATQDLPRVAGVDGAVQVRMHIASSEVVWLMMTSRHPITTSIRILFLRSQTPSTVWV